jgi:hypothetical protein
MPEPEREATPDEIANFVAQARGGDVQPKRQWQRDIVAAIHRDPEQESNAGTDELEEFAARLLAPKRGHIQIVQELHGGDDE